MRKPGDHSRRLLMAIAVFATVYISVLTIYYTAVGPAPEDAPRLWYAWRALGAACLSSTAVEIGIFIAWSGLKAGRIRAAAGVPLRLSGEDRRALARARPSLALVMPAHGEASTPEDRAGLADRICDLLIKTPFYSTFFLLADSPAHQHENEAAVIAEVRQRLAAAGRSPDQMRLILEEYRDKPLRWRNKPGSLLRWLQRWGPHYEFMFVLDADSALADENRDQPETCDVVERMLVAMIRNPRLALLQATMHIRQHLTPWGWVQAINARVATAYYLKVFAWLYDRTTPCYGHNCLLRVGDFARFARNSLAYTSHDHVEAADLATAGRDCMITDAAITLEDPEDSLLGWLKRECRWSRGNGQWIVYLLKKRGLPVGPVVYMGLGVLQYVWALLGSLFFVASVVLASSHHRLIAEPHAAAAYVLVSAIVFALTVPRLLASPSLKDFAASLLILLLLSPAIMVYQGLAFIMGALGSRWVPRGARSGERGLRPMIRIGTALLPIMLMGLGLSLMMAQADLSRSDGVLLMEVMVVSMVASPLLAVLVSRPWGRRQAEAQPPQSVDRAGAPAVD